MYSAAKVFTILHDAPSGIIARGVFLFWYGTITIFLHRRIEDHEGRGQQRICILCVIGSVCVPIIVGHRSNHALRRLWRPSLTGWDNAVSNLVWESNSAFLKLRFLLALSLLFPHPMVNLTCLLRKVVLWYDQLPPVTSLLADFNGFANSLPGSRCQKERIQRLVALRHHCHHAVSVASRTRQSTFILFATTTMAVIDIAQNLQVHVSRWFSQISRLRQHQ